ncbi:recombinase family protein [Coraliomargarita algicola]|uniref:Recombinase family protein n=1 Tax=Coraliomargarita algicola TaxID=3092156 RepID=A0ABZ0RQE9_9BACT|nr:recombinase family protein [Coraliomargarita sp. J2-16]WPJ95149.1 recombinase family protein [Coraliomargarita sp. J2-16]
MKKLSKYKQALRTIVRVIIYLRVSTEDQARREDNSMGTQEVFCERLIALNEGKGWMKIRVIKDAGYSAKNLKRPGIQQIIEAINADEVDVVVIYKLDRLTRSMRDLYKLWEIMELHGVDFASATESFNSSTPDGRAALNQRMTFAQWEREMTSLRLKDKYTEEARMGRWHRSMVPFGYESDTSNHTLNINPAEAKIVKVMYQLAAAGKGLKEIADHVNALGSTSKKRIFNKGRDNEREVGGRKWTVKSVRNLIENLKYKAATRDNVGNEYPALWEAIVTDKLWGQANRALENRREQVGRPQASLNKHELVLKGLIGCGHCGCALSPRAGGRKLPDGSQRAYYCCQNVIDFGKNSSCQLRNLPGADFDQFLVRTIGAFAQHPKVIKATLRAALEEKKKSVRPLRSQLREVTQHLTELNQEIKNLLNLARKGRGAFSNELYSEADELTAEKQAVTSQREQIKAQIRYKEQIVSNEEVVAKALSNFSKVFYTLTFTEREELIGLLVKSLKVSRLDPTSNQLPCQVNAENVGRAAKYYRVEIEFFIQSVFGSLPEQAGNPDLGSSGYDQVSIRTRMHSTFVIGLIGQDWKTGAFLVHPFQLEKQSQMISRKLPNFRIRRNRHLLETAIDWMSILTERKYLTPQDIAQQVELTPRRIRQILDLTCLQGGIQEFVLNLPPKKASKLLSERTLRPLCRLTREEQWARFEVILKIQGLA